MLQTSRAKSGRPGDSGTIPAITNRSHTVSHRKYCCDRMTFQGCGQLGLCTISKSQTENVISPTNLDVSSTIVTSKLGHVPWHIIVLVSRIIMPVRIYV